MHLRVVTCINLADCFLAADIEKQDLLVGADTDGEGTVCRHLDAVNVTTVTAQISDVDASLAVPHLDVFIDLTAG